MRYPWHPLHGQRVRVYGRQGRAGRQILYIEVRPGLSREIPPWMCDSAVCAAITSGRAQVAVAGLIELRNVGIVTLPTAEAPVALVLNLRENAHRFVECAESADIAGHAIPALSFDPRGPAAAVRAEYALALHGLSAPPSSV